MKEELVIVHCPFSTDYKKELSIDIPHLEKYLSKCYKINHYYTKFHLSNKTAFNLKDLKFESVAKDINEKYPKKVHVLGIEHGSGYALYYSKKYNDFCFSLLCFPLRGYTQYALERRIYKYKDNGGWIRSVSTKYSIEDYFININNRRVSVIK